MFCDKCGAQLPDDSKFCIKCGIECTEVQEPAKKRKGKKALLITLSVIVILTAAVLIFGKMVFYAASPETYVGFITQNTFNELGKELKKAGKELTGIKPAKDDYTITFGYEETDDDIKKGSEIKISVSNENEEIKIDNKNLRDGKITRGVKLFTNNSEAGAGFYGVSDEFLTLSSAKFGEQWNKSVLAENQTMSDALDISFSNIKKMLFGDKLTKEARKKLEKRTIEFLKEADIGGRESTKIEIDGRDVSAKEIRIEVSAEAVRAYLTDVCDIISENSEVGEESLKKIKENISEFDTDLQITLTEYRAKVVGVEVSYKENTNEETTVTLRFGSKTFINNIEFSCENRWKGGTYSVKISSEGNHVPKKDVFTDDSVVEVKYDSTESGGYSYTSVTKHSGEFDLKNGTVRGSIVSEYGYKEDVTEEKTEYSGSCSNNGGLRVDIDKITVDGKNQYIRLIFGVLEGAENLFDVKEKRYVPDMSEEEIEQFISDIERRNEEVDTYIDN